MQVCRCFAMIVYRLQCTGLGEWCNYLNIPPVVINCPTNLRDMRGKGVHKGRQFPKVRPSESSAKGGETSEFEEVSFRSRCSSHHHRSGDTVICMPCLCWTN